MRSTIVTMVLAGVLVLLGCGGNDASDGGKTEMPPPGEGIWFTGIVRAFDPGVAIGGETDPAGFILEGDHAETMRKYIALPGLTKEKREKLAALVGARLYLRAGGALTGDDLESRVGRKVHVTGRLDVLSAGGVETELRHFPVLDVAETKPAS